MRVSPSRSRRTVASIRFSAVFVAYLLGSVVTLTQVSAGNAVAEDDEHEAPAVETTAVATIDGESITVAEFADEIARRSQSAPGAFSDSDRRLEVLGEMVRFEVLAAAARRAGYAHDPEILRAVERLIVTRFKREQLDPLLDALTVEDDEVAREYRDHLADYTIPERVRIAMIFIEVPDSATGAQFAASSARAAEALNEARAQARESRSFGGLAKEYSDDRVSRYLGGDVGWVSKGQTSYRWDDVVVEAMFALERPGDLSGIVHVVDGLYLLKLTNREESRPRPLEQVAASIRHRLLRSKREQVERGFLEQLSSGMNVQIDHRLVESIDLDEEPAAEESPPRLPGY